MRRLSVIIGCKQDRDLLRGVQHGEQLAGYEVVAALSVDARKRLDQQSARVVCLVAGCHQVHAGWFFGAEVVEPICRHDAQRRCVTRIQQPLQSLTGRI